MVSRNFSNISDKTLQDGLLLMSSKQSVSFFSNARLCKAFLESLELQMLSPVTIYHEITISMWCDQISQELIWECQNHSHLQAQLMSTIPRFPSRASLRCKIEKGLRVVHVIPQLNQFFWSVLVVVIVLNCHHFSFQRRKFFPQWLSSAPWST